MQREMPVSYIDGAHKVVKHTHMNIAESRLDYFLMQFEPLLDTLKGT